MEEEMKKRERNFYKNFVLVLGFSLYGFAASVFLASQKGEIVVICGIIWFFLIVLFVYHLGRETMKDKKERGEKNGNEN